MKTKLYQTGSNDEREYSRAVIVLGLNNPGAVEEGIALVRLDVVELVERVGRERGLDHGYTLAREHALVEDAAAVEEHRVAGHHARVMVRFGGDLDEVAGHYALARDLFEDFYHMATMRLDFKL